MGNSSEKSKCWQIGKALPQAFFDIAKSVYQNNPLWIPESETAIRARFSQDNEFFKDNEASIFIEKSTRLVGFFNPSLRINEEAAVFFGYWETDNDLASNRACFDALTDWAKARNAKKIFGPINFSTYNEYRLRTDGFDRTPFPGEPYNPPYYPDLMAQLGLQVAHHFSTSVFEINYLISHLEKFITPIKAKAEKEGIHAIKLSPEYWLENLPAFYQIIDTMFKDNFAYTPIPYSQFEAACGTPFAKKFCPNTSILFLQNKKVIGFQLTYPHYGELLIQGAPERILPELLSYDSHFNQLSKPKLALGKTLAILPEYRSQGLFYLLMHEAANRAIGLYDYCAGAMVRDDNHSAAVEQFAQNIYRYALYVRSTELK